MLAAQSKTGFSPEKIARGVRSGALGFPSRRTVKTNAFVGGAMTNGGSGALTEIFSLEAKKARYFFSNCLALATAG